MTPQKKAKIDSIIRMMQEIQDIRVKKLMKQFPDVSEDTIRAAVHYKLEKQMTDVIDVIFMRA